MPWLPILSRYSIIGLYLCSILCYSVHAVVAETTTTIVDTSATAVAQISPAPSPTSEYHAVDNSDNNDQSTISVTSPKFWASLLAVLVLVVISGIMAGLTLGLMSLDETKLQIMATAGTEKQQLYATRIIPIRSKCHLLLTTLVLTNTVVNETLPVVLDGIFGKGYIAIITSTVLLVLFSEIIPQAICKQHGLKIGAFLARPVQILMYVWIIVAWPIAKVLDLFLGDTSDANYSLRELKALAALHGNDQPLRSDAVTMIQGIINLQQTTVGDLKQYDFVKKCAMSSDTVLDATTIDCIIDQGENFIPVYDAQANKETDSDTESAHRHIIGVVSAKVASSVNPGAGLTLKNMDMDPVLVVSPSLPAVDLLRQLLLRGEKVAVIQENDTNTTQPEHTMIDIISKESPATVPKKWWIPILSPKSTTATPAISVHPQVINKETNVTPTDSVGIITLVELLERLASPACKDPFNKTNTGTTSLSSVHTLVV